MDWEWADWVLWAPLLHTTICLKPTSKWLTFDFFGLKPYRNDIISDNYKREEGPEDFYVCAHEEEM